jgi:hypothetical protein
MNAELIGVHLFRSQQWNSGHGERPEAVFPDLIDCQGWIDVRHGKAVIPQQFD